MVWLKDAAAFLGLVLFLASSFVLTCTAQGLIAVG